MKIKVLKHSINFDPKSNMFYIINNTAFPYFHHLRTGNMEYYEQYCTLLLKTRKNKNNKQKHNFLVNKILYLLKRQLLVTQTFIFPIFPLHLMLADGRQKFPIFSRISVCDCISDDIFQENLQYTTGLLVDQTRDTLDTTSAGKTTDGWLCDTLDVITEHLPVALSAPLSKTFASFTTSRHDCCIREWNLNAVAGSPSPYIGKLHEY